MDGQSHLLSSLNAIIDSSVNTGKEFSELAAEDFSCGNVADSTGLAVQRSGSNNKKEKLERKRSLLACARCRRRHVKCPGGTPCEKCLLANVTCEYHEPNKKLIVSMNYLQKLRDDLAQLKRENVRLQSLVIEKSDNSELNRCQTINSYQDQSDVSISLSPRTLPLEPENDKDINFQKNTIPDDEEFVPNFARRRGRLVESRTGQKYFVGASSMTLFGMEIQSLIPESLLKLTKDKNEYNQGFNDVLDPSKRVSIEMIQPELIDKVLQEEGNAYKVLLTKGERNYDSVNFRLPTYSYAILLVDTFVTYNDGCFYFFNEGIVKYNLQRVYSQESEFRNQTIQTIWFCKILLIFAIGEMYLSPTNFNTDNRYSMKCGTKLPGSGFFEQASQIFSCLFSSDNIENVTKEGGIEVMLLYAFYLQVADCTVASYFYFEQALRACLILGWHVDAQRDTLTRFELEHRRRIWWTVYMYERMLSSKAGLPLSFADYTITTELPDDFNMSNPPPNCEHYIFPEAEYITNCVRITQINSQILNKLYQKQPESNILSIVKEIVMQLLGWRKNLPDFLQIDFQRKKLIISRLCTNMFTEYFQGMNLAIRPLLFHFASIQLKQFEKSNAYINLQNYSKTISSLLNCSLQASINSIRSLWALEDQNMIALFGYMDREYLFTSACTLILFNAAFGIHEQTYEYLDYALRILTKMGNLGNSPASLRKAQLLKLMTNLDFHDIMKDLIKKHMDNSGHYFQVERPPQLNKNQIPIFSNILVTNSNMDNNSNSLGLRHSHINELSKNEAQTIERNASRLDTLNFDNNHDLQKLLNNLDEISKTDHKLWKEVSDQAMWLFSAMSSTNAVYPDQNSENSEL